MYLAVNFLLSPHYYRASFQQHFSVITDLLVDVLNNVLDSLSDPDLNNKLLENTLSSLSWKMKAKYPPLMVLLPRVKIQDVFETNHDFGHGLCQSLTSNHLASSGASVYRIIVKTKDIFQSWKKYLLKPFIDSLCHDSKNLVRNNAKNHWLNPTLKYLPKEAHESMLNFLCDCDECYKIQFLIVKGQRLNGQMDQIGK